MKNVLVNHDFHYALESLIRVFFPEEKISNVYSLEEIESGESFVVSVIEKGDEHLTLEVEISFGEFKNKSVEVLPLSSPLKEQELKLSQLMYDMLVSYTGYRPKWGLQTGVRPSKLLINRTKLMGRDKALDYLKNELKISEEKVSLTKEVVKNEAPIISENKREYVSVYISIPFCPSRCAYCSFISHSIENAFKLLPDYVEYLCREIDSTAEIIKQNKLVLKSIYIGGGTPTTLSAQQLKILIDKIQSAFDFSCVSEFCIEAGRPDTLTSDKLEVIKKSRVSRITINPQTFNDDILKNIGRKHTVADTVRAFNSARALGFDNINMDLIAGLQGDTVSGFVNSVKSACELSPESITVHTLALKRSSYLVTENRNSTHRSVQTSDMLEQAEEILRKSGYIPYYMYRQSKSVGNLENVGWCKPGKECIYNVYMMEEIHSIIGIGAGAVSRLKDPDSDKIKRVYNYKYPYEYINLFSEVLRRKDEVNSILKEF